MDKLKDFNYRLLGVMYLYLYIYIYKYTHICAEIFDMFSLT